MKPLVILTALAALAGAQPMPLNQRVLVIVNDRSPEGASLSIGKYYAARRGIPEAHIFHLKTTADEVVSMEDYKGQIETPLRKFLDAHDGSLRKQILYLAPIYGVPVRIGQDFAVDSYLSMMYVGHEDVKPPLRNPYHAEVGSRPLRFDAWSDETAARPGGLKMFLVTRLDGPSAAIARGLVDKALEAERSLTLASGIAYFDMQGTREPKEWQYAIDEAVAQAAELSKRRGFETVLHVQREALCRCPIAPAAQYYYDAAAKNVVVDPMGVTAGVWFPIETMEEGDFRVQLRPENIHNIGNGVTFMLGEGGNAIRLVYPFLAFRNWETSDEVVLGKTVNGAVAARATLRVTNATPGQNDLTELRLVVRRDRIVAYRNGAELLTAADPKAAGLRIQKVALEARCWNFRLLGWDVSAADGQTRRRASCRPARVRSAIRLRSSSASAPIICHVARPVGVVASISSVSDRNVISRSRKLSSMAIGSRKMRPNLSIFHTMSVSPGCKLLRRGQGA